MKKWLMATGMVIAGMAANPAFAHDPYHYHGATICYTDHGAHGYAYDHGYGHDRWRNSISYHGYYQHPRYYQSRYYYPRYYQGHGYHRQDYRGRVSVSTHSPGLSGHVNLRF